MKKFLTVLAIALIAITTVFADTVVKGEDNLVLSLTVAEKTTVGFTENNVKDIESIADFTLANDRPDLQSGDVVNVFASVISSHKGSLKVEFELPTAMTADGITDTVKLEYTKKPATTETIAYENTFIKKSFPISITVGDTSQVVAADYSATLKMTVSTV